MIRISRSIHSDLKAIKKAISRGCSEKLSYDFDSARSVNCFAAFLASKSGEHRFRITKILDDHVEGFSIYGNQRFGDCCIAIREIPSLELEVIHLYRGGIYKFESYGYLQRHIFGAKAWRVWVSEEIKQSFFNLRKKFRKDRIEVLRQLVDLHLGDESVRYPGDLQAYSIHDFFEKINGWRSYNHPNFDNEIRLFALIIESLAETGELCREEHRYRITGKALATISSFEETERRYKMSIAQGWLLAALTFALVTAEILPFWVE